MLCHVRSGHTVLHHYAIWHSMMGEEPTRQAIYYEFETADCHFMDGVLKVVYVLYEHETTDLHNINWRMSYVLQT